MASFPIYTFDDIKQHYTIGLQFKFNSPSSRITNNKQRNPSSTYKTSKPYLIQIFIVNPNVTISHSRTHKSFKWLRSIEKRPYFYLFLVSKNRFNLKFSTILLSNAVNPISIGNPNHVLSYSRHIIVQVLDGRIFFFWYIQFRFVCFFRLCTFYTHLYYSA